MGNPFDHNFTQNTTVDVLTSTGDDYVWSPGQKVEIIAALDFISVQTGNDPAGLTALVKWDKRPTVQSDTGRGDGDIVSMTYPTTAVPVGSFVYKELTTPIVLYPGEQAVREVTRLATGSAIGCLVYRVLSERPDNLPVNSAGSARARVAT